MNIFKILALANIVEKLRDLIVEIKRIMFQEQGLLEVCFSVAILFRREQMIQVTYIWSYMFILEVMHVTLTIF